MCKLNDPPKKDEAAMKDDRKTTIYNDKRIVKRTIRLSLKSQFIEKIKMMSYVPKFVE